MNKTMLALGRNRSAIRELFEYGKEMKERLGEDQVFDFSLGNPNVPAPKEIKETYLRLLESKKDSELHGYTSAPGDLVARRAIAEDLNRRFQTTYRADNLFLICGAAAGLKIALTALCQPGDEVIVIAPFFPEYRIFVETSGAKLVVCPADSRTFQLDLGHLAFLITTKTRALILNSPNNPTGVLYPEKDLKELSELLLQKGEAIGHPITLISDEPYRELVYDAGRTTPFLPKLYPHTLVCYSYSKSLSLPGERLGYLLIPESLQDAQEVYDACAGAARALGYVCAPSLLQHVVAECADRVTDLSTYRRNRELLYTALTKDGFHCIYPEGAFYLFMQAPEEDAKAFSDRARRDFQLLLVPSDSFGISGYVRISYCVSTEMIERSLPSFHALAESYR